MAILRPKDIRKLSYDDAEKKLTELMRALSKERGKIDVGGVPDNPGKVREIRRTIARIKTIQPSLTRAKKKDGKEKKAEPEDKEVKSDEKTAKGGKHIVKAAKKSVKPEAEKEKKKEKE